jgi:hypothetical protein
VRFAPVTATSLGATYAGTVKAVVAGLTFTFNSTFPSITDAFPATATPVVPSSTQSELAAGASYTSTSSLGPTVSFSVATTNADLVVTGVRLGGAVLPFSISRTASAVVVTPTSFTAPASGSAVFTISMSIGTLTSAVDATVAIYGPFNYEGRFTSDSNAAFDADLKRRAEHMGIRDFEAVNALALDSELKLAADVAMPANNRLLVWRRP